MRKSLWQALQASASSPKRAPMPLASPAATALASASDLRAASAARFLNSSKSIQIAGRALVLAGVFVLSRKPLVVKNKEMHR